MVSRAHDRSTCGLNGSTPQDVLALIEEIFGECEERSIDLGELHELLKVKGCNLQRERASGITSGILTGELHMDAEQQVSLTRREVD